MKKSIAIGLLILFALNIAGPNVLSAVLKQLSALALDKKIEQKIYDDADLVIIKRSVNLPYYNITSEYRLQTGTVEVKGQTFHFVKSRVVNDTLELLCLPNVEQGRIAVLDNALKASLADATNCTKDAQKINSFKKAFTDFDVVQVSANILQQNTPQNFYGAVISFYTTPFLAGCHRPPNGYHFIVC